MAKDPETTEYFLVLFISIKNRCLFFVENWPSVTAIYLKDYGFLQSTNSCVPPRPPRVTNSFGLLPGQQGYYKHPGEISRE